MPTNEVVGLSVEMKVQAMLDELKRLGPGADKEAKAIAASLGKSLKDSEKAAKNLADQMKKTGDAGKGGLDKAAKALGPLGGVLSKLDPQLGSVASSIAAMTSAGEGFAAAGTGTAVLATGAAAATLATVLAVGYLAWTAYNDEAARGAEVAAMVATAEAKLAPLIDATRLAEIDAAVATGQMTDAAAKLEREGIASMKAFASATADASAQIKALHAGEGTPTRWYADMVEAAQGSTVLQIASLGTVNALAAMTESGSEAQTKIDALMGVETHAAAIVKEGTLAREKSAGVTKHHAAATIDLNAALLKEADAAEKSAAKFAAHLAAVEADAKTADGIVEKSGAFRLLESEKLARQEDADLAEYETRARAGAKTIDEIAAGEVEIRANYADQITAKEIEENRKRVDDDAAAAKKTVDARRAAADAIMAIVGKGGEMESSLVGSIDTITQNQLAAHDTTTAAGKAAARKAWQTTHALAMADAVIQGAIAEMGFIADGAQKGGVIGAAIEGVAGAAVVGAGIAAVATTPEPSFHRGYAPDETAARVLKSEPIVSPTGAGILGRDNIAAANAGRTPSYSGPAPIVVGHQVFNTLIKREIANGGALSAALTAGAIVGHRTNRRGTNG